MSLRDPTQVPERVRHGAAQKAAATTADPDEKLDIIAAALFPSATVYYVAKTARTMLERWAA